MKKGLQEKWKSGGESMCFVQFIDINIINFALTREILAILENIIQLQF